MTRKKRQKGSTCASGILLGFVLAMPPAASGFSEAGTEQRQERHQRPLQRAPGAALHSSWPASSWRLC
eukprot:5273628-Pleurochrysis_carterae.AAC.3